MRILSIETSCDDTGVAILEIKSGKFHVLANELSSQVKLHAKYGGVYPSLAKREHIKNLPVVLRHVLAKAKLAKQEKPVDAIALTVGPGLDPCLWTGINFAKELAKKWDVPIIPVNHLEGHMLISLLMAENKKVKPAFPAIALIVSGGHTQLVLVKKIGSYKIIGETRDDAAGECFDKTARILGLPYPGGPAVARAAGGALTGKPAFSIKLPRPMIHTKDYDFSFSGLKTAVLYDFQSRTVKVQKSKEYIRTMAKEIQQAIIDVFLLKTLRAVDEYDAKAIVLGGGVAANEELRKQFQKKMKILVAPKELCTDNGLMIALAGYFRWRKKKYTKNVDHISAEPNLRIE